MLVGSNCWTGLPLLKRVGRPRRTKMLWWCCYCLGWWWLRRKKRDSGFRIVGPEGVFVGGAEGDGAGGGGDGERALVVILLLRVVVTTPVVLKVVVLVVVVVVMAKAHPPTLIMSMVCWKKEMRLIPSHAGKVLTAIKSSIFRNRRLHLGNDGPNAVITVIVR